MARTKKSQEDAMDLALSQTDLEMTAEGDGIDRWVNPEDSAGQDTPQTDPESEDFAELQDGSPQTDPESENPAGLQGGTPQTDSGSENLAEESKHITVDPELPGSASQTDLESIELPPGQAEITQTDLETPENPEMTEPQGDNAPPDSQTDPGSATGVRAPDPLGDAAAPASQADTPQPQRLRMPARRGPRVVTIDAERTVATDSDRIRDEFLDLVESMKSKRILTGTIQGVGRSIEDPDDPFLVTYHGDFTVMIPASEAIEEPEDYRGQPKGDVLYYLLNKRMGAEIDYVVTGFESVREEKVRASRLQAMAIKRRDYFYRTDREGNYQIYSGACAEARVVSVIRAGIFVDLFGLECYIPLRELSYQRWVDASTHFQPGQRVLVKVLEVDRSERGNLQVSASVKQAGENPYEKALRKYTVGNRYVGTVSMVDTAGVFVSLDGGIDCLCTYPSRGRPPRGCRVTVRILGIDEESNRIWGVITHMSTVR